MSRWDGLLDNLVPKLHNKNENSQAEFPARVLRLEENFENAIRQIKQLGKTQERQRVVLQQIRENTSRCDDAFTKTTTDVQYIQQQLEYVVMSLEKERGIVAGHTEQLRLFARETNRRDGHGGAVSEGDTSLLFWLATWLHYPLVHFAKGCYTMLSPFINTIRSLSLFNSDVLVRQNEAGARFRDNETGEDLLRRLQRGTLDPVFIAKKS